jgi:hypothetical protein
MWVARTGIIASSGGSMDVDALAFITAATITDNTQKSAVNQLVKDLKSANIWTKMKAIYPMVGGSASSHKFNLKDPRDLDSAFRLIFNGGGIHSSTGYLPNGTTSYADTKLNPSVALTNVNQHISYYSLTNTNVTNVLDMGCQDDNVTQTGRNLYAFYSTVTPYRNEYAIQNNDATVVTYQDTNSLGFIMSSRTSLNLLEGYRNGFRSAISTASNPNANRPNLNVYIGGFNYVGGGGIQVTYKGVRECAFSSIGDGLTDTEATAFYTAVQAYQTTLGRQV